MSASMAASWIAVASDSEIPNSFANRFATSLRSRSSAFSRQALATAGSAGASAASRSARVSAAALAAADAPASVRLAGSASAERSAGAAAPEPEPFTTIHPPAGAASASPNPIITAGRRTLWHSAPTSGIRRLIASPPSGKGCVLLHAAHHRRATPGTTVPAVRSTTASHVRRRTVDESISYPLPLRRVPDGGRKAMENNGLRRCRRSRAEVDRRDLAGLEGDRSRHAPGLRLVRREDRDLPAGGRRDDESGRPVRLDDAEE